jgi:hypothetical protein
LPRIVQGHRLRVGIESREKQAVSQHLRKRVGEFFERQFMEDLIAEDLKKPVKTALLVLALLPDELLAKISRSNLLRVASVKASCCARPMPSGAVEKNLCSNLVTAAHPVVAQFELPIHEIGYMAQRFALNAVLADPDEVEVVGENDVLRKALVASYLVRFQNLVEVFANGLVLNVAQN